MTLKSRFAPSPTGLLHIGNARSAVLNWAHINIKGWEFILRIDVPDPTSVASDATLEKAGEDAFRLAIGTPANEDTNYSSYIAELLAIGMHDEACNEILIGLGPTMDGRCWLAKNSASSLIHGDSSSPLGKVITTHRMIQVDLDIWTLSLDVWHRGGGSWCWRK